MADASSDWAVSRDSFQPRLVACHGVVSAPCCALAYDATQRLLAVAFSDGAVKLYGGAGLEATLVARLESEYADSGARDRDCRVLLAFMPSSPLLVHLTPGPPCEVHVWNCRTCAKVTTCLWPASDAVSSLCALPPPWPVALFASSDGDATLTAAGVTAAWGVELRDWRLQCGFGEGEAAGRVVSVDALAKGPRQLLGLSASDEGALCVCDFRGQKVVARTAAGECLLFAAFASSTACVTVHNISGGGSTPLLRLWQLAPGGSELVLVVELALPETTHGAALIGVACARHSQGAHIFMACDLGTLLLCRVMTSSSGGGCSVAPPTELAVVCAQPHHMALLGTSLAHLTVATTDASTGTTCTLLAAMTPVGEAAAAGRCRLVQLQCTALATQRPLATVTAALPLDAQLRSGIVAAAVHAEEAVSPLLAYLLSQQSTPAQHTLLDVAESPAQPHRAVVTCHADGAATVWDASNAALVAVATARTADCSPAACAALCPASALLVTARLSGAIAVHAVDTPSCDVLAQAHTGAAGVTCVAMATAGVGLVAVGHDSGDVIVFRLADLQRCGQLSAEGGGVMQMQFCSGSDNTTALLLVLRSSGAVTLAHCSQSGGCRVVADAPADGNSPASKRRGLFTSKAPPSSTNSSQHAAPLSHAVALIALDASGGPCACVQAAMPGQFPRRPLPLPVGGDGGDHVSDGDDDDGDAAIKALLASSGGATTGALPPTRVVVFTATGAHALDLPPFDASDAAPLRLVPQSSTSLEPGAPRIMAAGCCVAVGGTAAVLLDAACVLHIWDAATLAPVMTAPLAGGLPGALCESVQGCQPECTADGDGTESASLPSIFAVGRDGHALACWAAMSSRSPLAGCDAFVRLELADEFCVPNQPAEYPPVNSLWSTSREASGTALPPAADDADGPRSTGAASRLLTTFAGLKAGVARAAEKGKEKLLQALTEPGAASAAGPGDWEAVFPPMPVATLVVGSAASPKAQPAPTSREDRATLLGDDSGGAPRMRSAEEIKARYGRDKGGGNVREVSHTMGENLDKLKERGQKLSNIQDKTAAMEAEAQQFSENARKLAELQGVKAFFRW